MTASVRQDLKKKAVDVLVSICTYTIPLYTCICGFRAVKLDSLTNKFLQLNHFYISTEKIS